MEAARRRSRLLIQKFTPAEIPQPPTLTNIYATLQHRLTERAPSGALPEGIPLACQNLNTECDRKGRTGRIRFTPRDVMGTELNGSEETFRIKYVKGFCEFGVTGTYTVNFLTLIIKWLIPDWSIILDAREGRDITNVIEFATPKGCVARHQRN
jgi:hypothetical protein